MASDYEYDLAVLGAGPGGYVSAIRAAQLGLRTALIERDKPGGVCLNVGCIPSKALIHQAEIFESAEALRGLGVSVDASGLDYSQVKRKSRTAADRLSKGVQYLIKKNGITYIEGTGSISGPNALSLKDGPEITARNIIIAAGSRPKEIPGFPFDHEIIVDSTDALLFENLPEKLLILGAGVIGMEFAYIASAFGCKVTVVEMLSRALPNEEPEVSDTVLKAFKKRGITVHTQTKALSGRKVPGGIELEIETPSGGREVLEAGRLLVAVGRTPNTEGLGLDKVGIALERGFIPVGDYYQTKVPSIYAVGDVIDTPQLAHAASREGEIAVSRIAGKETEKRLSREDIPMAVYCNPQVGSFGLTEEKAGEGGFSCKTAAFPYRGIGKAMATEQPDGFIKLVSDEKTGLILGCHIVGAEATELIHELLLAKIKGIPASEVAEMVHAHPTLSEGLMEACLALKDRAIHM